MSSASAIAAPGSLCATVRIQIKQKVSLERQAFDAVLKIHNGLSTKSVDDVSVTVEFSDMDGNPVIASSDPNNTSASFFIRLDDTSGLGAVDGSGHVAPQSMGIARWMIIPAADTGGTSPFGKMYMVGAQLHYRIGTMEKDVEVIPERITVKPQPKLKIDYFLADEVYADDPFTPEQEPAIPFTLGVRLQNTGAGTGHKVTIESAQPEIIDNKQGLLIDFHILGGHVGNQPVGPSLLLDFGDIEAGGVRMGRWLMETTLSGRFVSMQARYTHAGTLGGALTSLIDGQPQTHLLVHDVLVDLPGRDDVRDFLARDTDVLRVYESNGVDSEVVDQSGQATLAAEGSGQFAVSIPSVTGFAYAKLDDPMHGTASGLAVRRADGTMLDPANAWYSRTRKHSNGWNFYLNIFDPQGGGDYTVIASDQTAHAALEGSVFVDSNGNGERDEGEPSLPNVQIILEGDTIPGSVHRATYANAQGEYRFASLPEGTYTLVVDDVPGYANGAHKPGSSGGIAHDDQIAQIQLDANTKATGYVFAKVPVDVEKVADLQFVGLRGDTPVRAGEPAAVHISVRNLGPQATQASVSLKLPSQFNVDSASTGFDQNTGTWNAGTLLPGETVALDLDGHYSKADTYTISGRIQSLAGEVKDPDESNNTGEWTVKVSRQAVLSVDLAADRVPALLLWATCPMLHKEQVGHDCDTDRAMQWASLLANTGIRYQIVTEPTQFASALRSGDWNVIWIDNGADLAAGTLAAELREHVRRGGALILSGQRNPAWARFEKLAGVQSLGRLTDKPAQIQLHASDYFEPVVLKPHGPVSRYAPGSGQVLGEDANGNSIIVASHPDAQAPILIFGFDPLHGIADRPQPDAFLGKLAHGIAVTRGDPTLAGLRLPFRVDVYRPDADSGELEVASNYPSGFTLLHAQPSPGDASGSTLSWSAGWPMPQDHFAAHYVLRSPDASGTYTLLAAAQWQREQADDELQVHVRTRADEVAYAKQVLSGLVATGQDNKALKAEAVAQFDKATSAWRAGDLPSACRHALQALARLDAFHTPDADVVAVEVSWALLAMYESDRDTIFADGFEMPQ